MSSEDRSSPSEDTAQIVSLLEDDDIGLHIQSELIDPMLSNTRASELREIVESTFGQSENTALSISSSLGFDLAPTIVLAERERTCSEADDSSCGEWEFKIPLSTENVNGPSVIDDIDFTLIFERGTHRALGRALGFTVSVSDGEADTEEGTRRSVQRIIVHGTPITETLEDARETTYDFYNQRSWERAAQKFIELKEEGNEPVSVSVMFRGHIRSVTQHSINWFDVNDLDTLWPTVEMENSNRFLDAHSENHKQFIDLGLCEWEAPFAIVNGATITCSLADLESLLHLQPEILAGIYLSGEDPDESYSDGATFRSDSSSRLGRYLDVSPAEVHDGIQGSFPSGRIRVAYGDQQGFFQQDKHPAFYTPTVFAETRVIEYKSCTSSQCVHDPNQSEAESHGSMVLGAFQSILADQDWMISNPADQEARSFGAYSAQLRLFRTPNASSHRRGLEAAMGTSTYSSSDIWAGGQGSPNITDCNDTRGWDLPWTAMMDEAYNKGMFAVYGAGNRVHRFKSECSSKTYASRSDILVVGAFGDTSIPYHNWQYDTDPLLRALRTDLTVPDANTECPPDPMSDCDRCPLHPYNESLCYSSAEGGADLFVNGSIRKRARTIIDLTAPAGRRFTAFRDTSSPLNRYKNICCGTSYASPKAAATAVSVRDWGYSRSSSNYYNPTVIYALMILGADFTGGFPGFVDPMDQYAERPTGSFDYRRRFSRIWGAGRLYTHRLSGEGMTLTSPRAWSLNSVSIHSTGTTVHRLSQHPTPSSTKEITSVFAWHEEGLSGESGDPAANIVMYMMTGATNSQGHCPAQPEAPFHLLGQDTSYDTKKRLSFGPDVIEGNYDIIGRCIYMGIHTEALPSPRDGAFVMFRTS